MTTQKDEFKKTLPALTRRVGKKPRNKTTGVLKTSLQSTKKRLPEFILSQTNKKR